jgi:flagellar basal body-associated protein FliL
MAAGEGSPDTKKVADPGPIVSVGEFTSNLAGSGRHVITFTLSLEALNSKAAEVINSAGWLLRVKNEILLIVKDTIYEDLTSAEGALQFGEEIKRTLNAQLPDVRGEAPVTRVLFETFVLQ